MHPPSARRETWGVARAVFHIAFWSGLLVSAQTFDARAASGVVSQPSAAASPYERRFQDLAFEDQRIFRNVQEGLSDAERVRGASGRWPSPEELARRGVPPFVADPIDRAHYKWQMVAKGPNVDYVGTPDAGSGREAFFIVLAEPDPGAPDDPLAVEDELHHRLPNGPMIHVSIWMGPPIGELTAPFSALPIENGYRQILGGGAR